MIYSKLRYGDMTMGTILLPSLQLYVKEPSLRLLQGCIAPPPLFNLLSVLYSDCPPVQRHRKLTDPVDRIPMACPGEHQMSLRRPDQESSKLSLIEIWSLDRHAEHLGTPSSKKLPVSSCPRILCYLL